MADALETVTHGAPWPVHRRLPEYSEPAFGAAARVQGRLTSHPLPVACGRVTRRRPHPGSDAPSARFGRIRAAGEINRRGGLLRPGKSVGDVDVNTTTDEDGVRHPPAIRVDLHVARATDSIKPLALHDPKRTGLSLMVRLWAVEFKRIFPHAPTPLARCVIKAANPFETGCRTENWIHHSRPFAGPASDPVPEFPRRGRQGRAGAGPLARRRRGIHRAAKRTRRLRRRRGERRRGATRRQADGPIRRDGPGDAHPNGGVAPFQRSRCAPMEDGAAGFRVWNHARRSFRGPSPEIPAHGEPETVFDFARFRPREPGRRRHAGRSTRKPRAGVRIAGMTWPGPLRHFPDDGEGLRPTNPAGEFGAGRMNRTPPSESAPGAPIETRSAGTRPSGIPTSIIRARSGTPPEPRARSRKLVGGKPFSAVGVSDDHRRTIHRRPRAEPSRPVACPVVAAMVRP